MAFRLLVAAALLGTTAATLARAVTPRERLSELFRSLSAHGGPAYVSRADLELIFQSAELQLAQNGAAGDGWDDGESAYQATCRWVVSQLSDPRASHLEPQTTVATRARFHGPVGLGLTVSTRAVPRAEAGELAARADDGDVSAGGWFGSSLGFGCRLCTASRWRGWRRAAFVVDIESGSSASRAGIRVGDELLAVGDVEAYGGTLREAVARLVGEEGEAVALRLRRGADGAPRTCRLTHTPMPPPTVWSRRVAESDAHVVTIRRFGSTTAAELRAELRRLRAAPPAASIVFDVRSNEGGLLPEAIAAARMVLPRGGHVLSLRKEPGEGAARVVKCYRRRWWHRCELPPARRRGAAGGRAPPLVVLVDADSASSAEVFAGALAHAAGAVLIGQRTYGKGSSQAMVYQTDGFAVSFTAYTLALGKRHGTAELDRVGIEPHVRWTWRAGHASAAGDREIARALALAAASGVRAAVA